MNAEQIADEAMIIDPHTFKHQCQHNDLMQALDTERAAHEATKAELQALREAAQGACDWMEGLRASGDAGNWDWEDDDEYSKLLQALARKEA
jgi:hypothetical protein